jgi:hypothetical protein
MAPSPTTQNFSEQRSFPRFRNSGNVEVPLRVVIVCNVLNVAHPSTSSGRAEDRAGHGEPVEPLNDWNVLNVWNGPVPVVNGP